MPTAEVLHGVLDITKTHKTLSVIAKDCGLTVMIIAKLDIHLS